MDRRSDIWSVGVLLYFMFSGKLPFTGKDLPDLMQQLFWSEPKPLTEVEGVEVPVAISGAILRCLKKLPEDRFQSMHDLLQALEARKETLPDLEWPVGLNEHFCHHILANNYFRQGKFDLACLEWNKALMVVPSEAAYANNQGVARWRNGETAEAAELFQRAQSHFNLGLLLLEQADFWGARDALQKAIDSRPSLSASYILLGNAFLGLGKIHNAVEEFQKSLILEPASVLALRRLAEAYRKQGRLEEALASESKAHECGAEVAIEPLLMPPTGFVGWP